MTRQEHERLIRVVRSQLHRARAEGRPAEHLWRELHALLSARDVRPLTVGERRG